MMIPLMAAMTVLAANPNVSMEFDGTLKDGLKQLAQKSGINLVVIGEFDEKVNLNFPGVDGEQALETIAQAYGLEVTRGGKAGAALPNGKMWVIRRANSPVVAAPVMPVVPLTPVAPLNPEVAREAADQARRAADEARLKADVMRAKAEAMREVSEGARESAREAAEAAREEADAMREKADELREVVADAKEQAREQAREAAEAAREAAQEAAELAREQAQETAEAERERLEALRDQGQAQADLSRAQAELERHRVSTGGPVTVEKGSRVDTAVAYGGPVIVEEDAVVDGDAVAFGGDVVLKKGAVVQGDAVSFGGSVVKAEGAQVQGESVSMGGSGFGTAVARNVIKTQRSQRVSEAEDAGEDSHSGFGRGLAAFLLQFAVFFGLGFVLMMFAPQRMKALEATITEEPGKNGLAGFLGLLAAVPLTLMLVVTLVGIPVAMLLWIALALFIPVGLAVVANALGAKLPTGKLRKTQALVLAVGLFALLLIGQIPVLGPMVLALAVFISMGAIIRTRFGQGSRGTPMLDPMPAPSL
jgi:FKBP-type peptidyl-prolyl cis-trans isomerase